MVPSVGSKAISQETQARWAEISPKIGKALDKLTGTMIGDPRDWFRKVDEAKKNLKGFFKD
jgi:hypothetical protein